MLEPFEKNSIGGILKADECDKCRVEPGIGYDEDGEWLCEDCLFDCLIEGRLTDEGD